MKMQQTRSLKQLSDERMEQLTRQIKETVACEYQRGQEKIFSSADLWNIHRNRRLIYQRRSLA